MRRSHICICSTAHLPADERADIDALIAGSPRRRGRVVVDHPDLSIEPHQYGFSVHLGFFDDLLERPDTLSPDLWRLLACARDSGASWISFDCDEPPSSKFPTFEDSALRAAAPLDHPFAGQDMTMHQHPADRHAAYDDTVPLALEMLDIALSDEERSMAAILEFDPDADPGPSHAGLPTDPPRMHAISGAAFSRRTWEKLARRYFVPSPTLDGPQPLQRFLAWRARFPDA